MLSDAAPSSYGQRAPLGRRATGFVLALLANLLLILMLLSLAPFTPSGPPSRRGTVLIDLPPTPTPTRARTVDRRKTAAAAPSPPQVAPEPPPPPTPPVPWNIMIVTREVFAASDISKLPRRGELASNAAGPPAPGTRAGTDDGLTETGPNGERLYAAQWYVEPTNAELAGYLPTNAPRTGVGMIACRTVPRYRVDDCVELGESPAGSGLSRAIRQAAWQFKVRPPSIDGRPMVGAWVRIRVDFSQSRAP